MRRRASLAQLKLQTKQTTQSFVFDSGRQSYQQTIMFLITCDPIYALTVSNILRDWVDTAESYEPHSQNAPLVFGWTLASFLKSVELLKYTWKDWDTRLENDLLGWIQKLKVIEMWKQSILRPDSFTSGLMLGNWHTTIIEALLYHGFITDNKTTIDYVESYYKRMVDGLPNPKNKSQSDAIYIAHTGEQVETCRGDYLLNI